MVAFTVPVAAGVGRAGLFRVGDHERVLLGQLVHAGSGGEIGRVLAAAVQHLDDLPGRRAPFRGWITPARQR